jgi:hypothetical protein
MISQETLCLAEHLRLAAFALGALLDKSCSKAASCRSGNGWTSAPAPLSSGRDEGGSAGAEPENVRLEEVLLRYTSHYPFPHVVGNAGSGSWTHRRLMVR